MLQYVGSKANLQIQMQTGHASAVQQGSKEQADLATVALSNGSKYLKPPRETSIVCSLKDLSPYLSVACLLSTSVSEKTCMSIQ